MVGSTFKTNPIELQELLKECDKGILQLPDFQRSWVWDEDRITSLIASVSRAFPIGALMTLETGGIDFKPRPIEGAVNASHVAPAVLLLDGQQRMTSLYQVLLRGQVVEIINGKKKKSKKWFYLDIQKCLDETADRDECIISVAENKTTATNFGRDITLSLVTDQEEFEQLLFPVSSVFRWDDWQKRFIEFAMLKGNFSEKWPIISAFKEKVIDNFHKYHVPVITLSSSTSKEAVCVVFEKVNTGGKPLDAFELVTAMYAADGHELRKDWFGKGREKGRAHRFTEILKYPGQDKGILSEVSNTDFLQAISLFFTRDRRNIAESEGKQGKELPAVTSNRQALLNLPLEAYKKYEKQVEEGFVKAAKFLHTLHIYRVYDLPYQSQLVPLAAILGDIGDAWEHENNRAKIAQWYWNGVFGELYGSAVETRFARDFVEVRAWLSGGDAPATVSNSTFRADRLNSMRMRLSAAYKGVNALLMKAGARDFRSGQRHDHTVFFGENVDIHHIFPKAWCAEHGIEPKVFDSIINKTPLFFKTNRIIGGSSPSEYIAKLEAGTSNSPPIQGAKLDEFLVSNLISPQFIRSDNFVAFMDDRKQKLLALIQDATGKSAYFDTAAEEDDIDVDLTPQEADFTMKAA